MKSKEANWAPSWPPWIEICSGRPTRLLEALLGCRHSQVMLGRPKTALTSWVVSKKKHLPTGYEAPECHLGLTTNSRVIRSPDELRIWLNAHS